MGEFTLFQRTDFFPPSCSICAVHMSPRTVSSKPHPPDTISTFPLAETACFERGGGKAVERLAGASSFHTPEKLRPESSPITLASWAMSRHQMSANLRLSVKACPPKTTTECASDRTEVAEWYSRGHGMSVAGLMLRSVHSKAALPSTLLTQCTWENGMGLPRSMSPFADWEWENSK